MEQNPTVLISEEAIRARVTAARARQRERYERLGGVRTNADVPGRWLLEYGGISEAARTLLAHASARLGISARAYHRALRVARTITDLDGEQDVGAAAMNEALQYRGTGGVRALDAPVAEPAATSSRRAVSA